jgi:hypothetical protein
MWKYRLSFILAICMIGLVAGCNTTTADNSQVDTGDSNQTQSPSEGEQTPNGNHTHNYVATVVAPTCTQQGYTKHTCACGEEYLSSYTKAIGHQWEQTEEVLPTCLTGGYTLFTCTVCNESLKNSVEILNHTYSADTCLTCGNLLPTQGVVYELSADATHYTVVGLEEVAPAQIVIAATYQGLPVTEIASQAFLNSNALQTVYVPTTVNKIGSSAFKGCTSLISVTLAEREQTSWYGYLGETKKMSFSSSTQNATITATALKDTFYYYTWLRT